MNTQQIIEQIKQQSMHSLRPLVRSALEEAARELSGTASGDGVANTLLACAQQVCDRFDRYLGYGFDRLNGRQSRRIELGDYPALSVVDSQFLDAANALEGMINYARNTCIELLINFNTRLSECVTARPVDETNSPLDPDRISQAFVDALAPLDIDRPYLLPLYRQFNRCVLRALHVPLRRANEACLANGLLPELIVDGRSREAQLGRRSSARPGNSPLDRAFMANGPGANRQVGSAEQLYGIIRELLHGRSIPVLDQEEELSDPEVVVPTALLSGRQFGGSLFNELGLTPLRAYHDMQVAGRKVRLVGGHQLLEFLDEVQARLIRQINHRGQVEVSARQFTSLLGEVMLQASPPGTVNAIDGRTFDLLLTLSLLYEVFCHEISLVQPVKELIVATKVVMMKIALYEPDLLRSGQHPARRLLNEVASAGVGGVELDRLREDATFIKLEELLIRLVMEYEGNASLIEELLDELYQFNNEKRVIDLALGEDCAEAGVERQKRLAQVHHYVHEKIEERIQEPLHPVVEELVYEHYHRFLVSVVQRDGQGSNSWILVIKVLDLLLWTVRSKKGKDDLQRFTRLNSQLIPNLKKALLRSGLDHPASDALLQRFQDVQLASFQPNGRPVQTAVNGTLAGQIYCTEEYETRTERSTVSDDADRSSRAGAPAAESATRFPHPSLDGSSQSPSIASAAAPDAMGASQPALQQALSQAGKLPVGSWVRFSMEGDVGLDCTLAARLPTMDRLVFVNANGVKVVEKSQHSLALELMAGTVRIVSEWPLFERGLESVIARLRSRQS